MLTGSYLLTVGNQSVCNVDGTLMVDYLESVGVEC